MLHPSLVYKILKFYNYVCIGMSQIHYFFIFSWSFLEVTTSSQYNDSLQAYAAGAVEAALTSQVGFLPQA